MFILKQKSFPVHTGKYFTKIYLIDTLLERKYLTECLLNKAYEQIQRKVWVIT